MRLQFADHAEGFRPLIICLPVYAPGLIGTAVPSVASVGTIEPHFEDVPILGEQFAQLITEIGYILRTAVFGMVPVPGRQINGKFQPFLAACLGEFANDIALAALPGGVLDGVFGISRRPHTETAVMLGCENDSLHTSLLAHARPLPTIKVLGIEQGWILVAITPFLVSVGVHRVMDERIHLHILPPELVGARKGTARVRNGNALRIA